VQNVAEATALTDLHVVDGSSARVTSVHTRVYPVGDVVAQSPRWGTRLQFGDVVTIFVDAARDGAGRC
jgi:hypothetical protein